MRDIRVRFAPSPTGPLHVGGIRTALYNFLFAKKHHGKIILRIEDTDRDRYVSDAETYLLKALTWLGISFDEGPHMGGPHQPYRQSERKQIYQNHAQQLICKGHAYYAFDTPNELTVMRQGKSANSTKEGTGRYDNTTRMQMRNSLTLSNDVVKKLLKDRHPHVVRFKMPVASHVVVTDAIRGKIEVSTDELDDKVLLKADGMPTYHLANVIDDHDMDISHVIRGEEWLPSVPLHVLLYKSLGWSEQIPVFAHLPLLLNPTGSGKLSKRDIQSTRLTLFPLRWKDPASGEVIEGLQDKGYSPAALINFLALLGWNPSGDKELFVLDELINAFDLNKINKGGAKFLIEKAKWFNQEHLRRQTKAQMVSHLKSSLQEKKILFDNKKLEDIVQTLKERVVFPQDFYEMGQFFFTPPHTFDAKVVTRIAGKKVCDGLQSFVKALACMKKNEMSSTKISSMLEDSITKYDILRGKFMQAIRLSLTGGLYGPDLYTIIDILEAPEVIYRIQSLLVVLNDANQ